MLRAILSTTVVLAALCLICGAAVIGTKPKPLVNAEFRFQQFSDGKRCFGFGCRHEKDRYQFTSNSFWSNQKSDLHMPASKTLRAFSL